MADRDEQDAAQEQDKLIPNGDARASGAKGGEEEANSVLSNMVGRWVPSSKHALGAFFLIVVAVIWTAASFLVQYIQQDLGFAKPLFITYVSNALFSILLVLEYARARLGTTPHYSYLGRPGDVSWKREARAAAKVAVIWFAAQATYNWSLNGTTVSVSTILSSTSCVFTFAMSLVALREKFSLLTMLGVLLT
jgi:solute carrier family 35 protein F5